ncbi:MAG: GGDEF domain-containing protein [Paraglaciecola sp.]|uniref:tetratricopeptide repeat-containing diguanylate cyclase n=1 Tax=Paraglaciecola sp. TaxID=1920173 RepID=UPI003299D27A
MAIKKYLATFMLLVTTEFSWGGEAEQPLLDKAYEIRNQDRAEYNRLLSVLKTKDLTTIQQDFLTYLQARRALISDDDATKAIELAKMSVQSTDVRIAIISDQLLSNIFNLNFDLEQAFNHIFHALALTHNYENKEVVATVYAGAANLYAELEDYETAAEFGEKAITTSNTSTQRCFIYATVGLSGNRQIDRDTLEKGISACKDAQQELFIYLLYLNHTEYLLENEEPLAAYNFIKKYFTDFESLGFDSYIYSARMLIGRSARRIGKLDEALEELTLCLQASDDDDSEQIALRELALISLQQKEFEQAANYFNRLDYISKRVMDNKLNNQLAYQAAKFKSLDRQNQIGNLTRTNELNELRARLDDSKIKLLVISIVLVVLIAIITTIVIYKRAANFRRDAFKDGLTNIGNRRWFDQHLRKLLNSHRNKLNHCLVIFDLDKFKIVNDKYGHAAGDIVIKKVCETVKTQIRTNDPFARIGGEEFAIILENCTLDDAKERIEKCRAAVDALTFEDDLSDISISASFGICCNFQAENDDEKIFKHADQALYESKKNGRNQVSVFEDE